MSEESLLTAAQEEVVVKAFYAAMETIERTEPTIREGQAMFDALAKTAAVFAGEGYRELMRERIKNDLDAGVEAGEFVKIIAEDGDRYCLARRDR